MRQKRGERGFTMIEVLVTIAIAAIVLTTISLAIAQGFSETAQASKRLDRQNMADFAADTFAADAASVDCATRARAVRSRPDHRRHRRERRVVGVVPVTSGGAGRYVLVRLACDGLTTTVRRLGSATTLGGAPGDSRDLRSLVQVERQLAGRPRWSLHAQRHPPHQLTTDCANPAPQRNLFRSSDLYMQKRKLRNLQHSLRPRWEAPPGTARGGTDTPTVPSEHLFEGNQTVLKNLMNREDWSEKNVAQKGFTLIELLVVIAILGILAVVGVLAFGGLTDSAKSATNRPSLTQVETAVDAYLAKDATPAHTLADLGGVGSLTVATLETDKEIKDAGSLKCDYTLDADGVVSQTAGSCS